MKRVDEVGRKAPGADGRERKELLLYVEDDIENWEVARLRLGHTYEIVWAKTDLEACRIVKERSPELVAILMDIELQGSQMDGIQLTRLFKGKTTASDGLPFFAKEIKTISAPILFVTAYTSRYEESVLKAAGGDKVIRKPVDFSELMLALTSLHLSRIVKHAPK